MPNKKSNFISDVYQQFIYKSRYARYLDKESRREEWPETVERYFDFMEDYLKENHEFDLTPYRSELEEAVLNRDVMPSMRALMTAGPALRRDEASIYNCAFISIDSLRSFDEELYTLMLGTGVGFSVEQGKIQDLPIIADDFHQSETTIVFEDSRIGWAKGYREYMALLSNGQIPRYDTSKLRPKGARLKTFGGRSSGPEPLIDLLEFTKQIFVKAAGRRLNTIECHDIACKIADIVVVGGVRRSALISLSDLNDDRMRHAKSGRWYETNSHRRLANNSAIYEEIPDAGVFMREWLALYESNSGERGIFSRPAAKHIIKHSNALREEWFGTTARQREIMPDFGTNPCSEIILRQDEFCNLTSVQIKETDSLKDLKRKIRVATILGTIQSCLTKFRYINKRWRRNCEDERLLGVSLNGIYDNALTNGKEGQEKLKDSLLTLRKLAIATNIEWAGMFGINPSVAITAIKPEGTTSAFNGTASGIHPTHAPYYVRYVRNDKKDPLTQFMIDAGFPHEEDAYDPKNMIAFKFPVKSSSSAICRNEVTAVDHLELWKTYQMHYCEHKPSVTITVKESEWMEVGAWVYKNFEWVSGVSFLPYDGGVYKQMPFTDCTEEEYRALLAELPKEIDWSRLTDFEKEDSTTNAQELACTGSKDGCFV